MTALIAVYTGDGCAGRCDAKCYNAWGPECRCICQGGNHGVGRQEAIDHTREQAESWLEHAEADRRASAAPSSWSVPGTSRCPALGASGDHLAAGPGARRGRRAGVR